MWVAAAGLLLVAAGLALALLVPRGAGHPVRLAGSAITGAPLAPDFRLTDQQGRAVSLSGLRGDVVLVTFLYVHCPDVCPLIASRLNATLPLLGRDAQRPGGDVDPRGRHAGGVGRHVRQRGLAPRSAT